MLHSSLQVGGTTTVRNRLYRAPVLEGAGDGDDCAPVYAKAFVGYNPEVVKLRRAGR